MQTLLHQPQLLSPVSPEEIGKLKVHLPAVKIVSFRGPGQSGGVASSLAPLTKQLHATVQWIALSGIPQCETESIAGFNFHKPEVAPELLETHSMAAKRYLWPLFHGLVERAHFDIDEWRNFKQLSRMLANEAQKISSLSFPMLVWLHDFETVLLAPELASDAGMILCHFWHIAWPEPEIIAGSPVGEEIVLSLLANQVIGFHTKEYAANFLNTVALVVKDAVIDHASMTIAYGGRKISVTIMPLGLDFSYWQRMARASRVEAEALPVRFRLANQIILGIDRIDYTKGILEKLAGLEAFLKAYPEKHRRFHYVQLAQLSSDSTDEIRQYKEQIEARVTQINSAFRSDGWEPIRFMEGNLTQLDLAAWYQTADVMMLTPIRDGLNLVAKEYVACRVDEQGTLLLSKYAGCAAELVNGAVIIDPLKPEDIVAGLAQCLSMDVEEKHRRMSAMRHVVSWNRLHDWACGFLQSAIAQKAVA